MNSEDEMVFAAAAQHLIALRRYDAAMLVLKAQERFSRVAWRVKDIEAQLAEARGLLAMIFQCRPGDDDSSSPLLGLRRIVDRVDRQLMRGLRRRGRRIRTLYDFLDAVKKRPAMYLGRESLEILRIHISCVTMFGLPRGFIEERPDFSGFARWVDLRYPKLQGGGHGWDNILIRQAGGDGPAAIKLFYRELALYRKKA